MKRCKAQKLIVLRKSRGRLVLNLLSLFGLARFMGKYGFWKARLIGFNGRASTVFQIGIKIEIEDKVRADERAW
jgi:hypothetical protein